MASEQTAEPAPAPIAGTRGMTRRKKRKLILVALVIAAAAIVIFWGWSSTGRSFLGVGSLVDESNATSPATVPEKYAGKPIEIQGNVDGWYGGPNFSLVEGDEPSKSISVHMLGTFPEGFEIGKTVVVKGTLSATMPLSVQATEITVGCASKY